jgi:competence protein ComFC
LAQRLEQLRKTAIDFFFPTRCVGCGRVGNFLCTDCYMALPHIYLPVCTRCGKPETSGPFCPTCWGWESHIDGIRSSFRFDGVIRQAIHEFKYKNLRAIASYLAEFLFHYLQTNFLTGNVLVPVPLHPRRLRDRGYNQSGLLAGELGKLAGIPVEKGCLVRSKYSPAQTRSANIEERRINVADAFQCVNSSLNGNRVILIDDVCTSGATLEACATAIKSTGAASVWGLTLAREI